jgi:CBS domain-containing protein
VWIDQRGSEVLSRRECRRLLALAAGGVGRLGYVSDGQPVVIPVNYRMLDGDVLVRIGPGTTAAVLASGVIVAFEVDEVDPGRGTAWSVLVQGLATVLEDPADLARAEGAGVAPFVAQPGSTYVRVRTGVLSGRRFPLRPEVGPLAAPRRVEQGAGPGGGDAERRPGGPGAGAGGEGGPGAGAGGEALTPARERPIGALRLEGVVTVGRDATIREVAARMEDAPSSFVLVGEHPGWLVTERDLVGALASGLGGADRVEAVATKGPVFATPSTTLAEAAGLMADHGIRHLLVVGPGGDVHGVLGLAELVAALLADAPGAGRAGRPAAGEAPSGAGPSALRPAGEEA